MQIIDFDRSHCSIVSSDFEDYSNDAKDANTSNLMDLYQMRATISVS